MKQKRNVSIKDIAEAAGTTHSTVSRALRDSPMVSEKTRIKVKKIAQQMGYMPNTIAQNLKQQRTFTVGLVIFSIAHSFFSDIVLGIEEVAEKAGFSLLLHSSHNDPEQEMKVIQTFHQRRVEGMILLSSCLEEKHMEQLEYLHAPLVFVSSQKFEPVKYRTVISDDKMGATQAINHLISLGHRNIGYLGVNNRPVSNQRRLDAYYQEMASSNLSSQENWVVMAKVPHSDSIADLKAGEEAAGHLIDAGVTAIMCYNDLIAAGAIRACQRRNLRVPEDVSITGYDDLLMASYLTPSLTTVKQCKLEMGRKAMEMLLGLMNGENIADEQVQQELVVRESTASYQG